MDVLRAPCSGAHDNVPTSRATRWLSRHGDGLAGRVGGSALVKWVTMRQAVVPRKCGST